MADGVVWISIVGFMGFWAIGIAMGRWSDYLTGKTDKQLSFFEE